MLQHEQRPGFRAADGQVIAEMPETPSSPRLAASFASTRPMFTHCSEKDRADGLDIVAMAFPAIAAITWAIA